MVRRKPVEEEPASVILLIARWPNTTTPREKFVKQAVRNDEGQRRRARNNVPETTRVRDNEGQRRRARNGEASQKHEGQPETTRTRNDEDQERRGLAMTKTSNGGGHQLQFSAMIQISELNKKPPQARSRSSHVCNDHVADDGSMATTTKTPADEDHDDEEQGDNDDRDSSEIRVKTLKKVARMDDSNPSTDGDSGDDVVDIDEADDAEGGEAIVTSSQR
ncbi:hypothetical protein QBC40DRAFT_254430 [Triangularia verruculosa]|uniref:Uncharacterized protein n=1 Tax=Triangularia verruculosa TaxID=2587418 RepID=A0AAN7AWJ1_9PEZI|nr:hypothetical protein QBC40DRAFT_254430 [Triangularia verruculosa]